MEQSFVEGIERRRYRLILWQTIGFAVWYPAFLFLFLGIVKAPWLIGVLVIPSIVGAAVFAVTSFRLARVVKQITADSRLRSAVNNELFIANEYKAGVWGYYATMVAIVVMFCLSIYIDIPGKMMGGILILVCGLSAKVAQLIVHR